LKENNKRINSERDVQNEIGRKAIRKGIDLTTLPDIKTESEDSDEEKTRAITDLDSQTAKTPTVRRILNAKRRSSSATASSKKGVSSVQSPTTPVSTGKRKQRSTISKNYRDGDDEEDEDSDFSDYVDSQSPTRTTPSKRAATRASRAKAATPTRARATPSKSASKSASAGLPVRNQTRVESGLGRRNRRSTLSSVVHASELEEEDKMKHKEIICDILQVDRTHAQTYSLEDLRFYARAYNIQFAADDWFLGTANEATGKMFRVITPTGIIHHFAHLLPHFVPLAIARGDLNPDSTINEKSPHMAGFSTNGDAQKDMALGVLPNRFGLHNQLWNLSPQ